MKYINMALVITSVLVYVLSLLPRFSLSFPLCTNSRVPFELKAPLKFCRYNGTSCCDSAEDFKLQKQFEALNLSDSSCASLVQSIICAKCDPYAAELFGIDTALRSSPILCHSTVPKKSNQNISFCTKVWHTCKSVSIYNSPFSTLKQERVKTDPSSSKLIDFWKSSQDFCKAYGGSPDDRTVCFNGESASFSSSKDRPPIKGICIEKIANGSYTSMAPHPDGSDRFFVVSQAGQIWLATVPIHGSNTVLSIDESKAFLDISDRVLSQTSYGLLGMAFHPDFVKNGRFFVSFNCDKLHHSGCSGRCACNLDAKCDPASLSAQNGIMPCQYHNVIAEYSVNGTTSNLSSAESANPSELRRIFTMGLPFHRGHAGQIVFGPADGYLYTVVAVGAPRSYDSYNFVQNKRSLLGKILRLDVDNMSNATKVNDENFWGNYSIPRDNPYMDDTELLPEIWALGFQNPWRCSFDARRPSYLLCGDNGQDKYQEVDIITKGGNYGWPMYEGPFPSNLAEPQRANQPPSSIIKTIFPVMGYNRSEVNGGASSIIGGYFYRSTTDPCLYGRYLFTDLYTTGVIWVGIEIPENSGNFTTVKMSYTCAKDSPLPCNTIPGSSTAAIGYIFSLGEDNRKDVYLLASTGVYRIAHPSRCNFSCPGENISDQQPKSSSSSSSSPWSSYKTKLLLLDYLLLWVLSLLIWSLMC